MKVFFSFSSSIAFILLLIGTQASISSCKKETVYIHDTTRVTVTRTDTVIHTDTVPPATLTNTQLLAKNKWEIQELYQIVPNSGGDTTHYVRGIENTTGYNQDVIRFTFHEDGTGEYIADNGESQSLAWQFTSADEKNMKLTVTGSNGPVIFYWSLVSISETEIFETTAQSNFLVSARLVPAQD
ncbi:MAG TPA: hypothetical protein VHB48_18745 [Chitinophagaceae bacterium]|nr:hypothetical protein [Chitinophagaceae bacterium]